MAIEPPITLSFDAIHLADRLGEAGALRPLARLEPAQVAQHLRRERLVHLDEVHVGERQPGALQRDAAPRAPAP